MKIHKGDKVQIMAGKDKGKIAPVLKAMPKINRVVVEGVNIVKKHVKPGTVSKEGGIVSIEKPIHVSNVMYYSDKEKRPVRIGYKIEGKKKIRISKSSGNAIESGVKVSKEADKKALKKKVEKKNE